LYDR